MNANNATMDEEQPTEETVAEDLGDAVETENKCDDVVGQLVAEKATPEITVDTPYDHIWAEIYVLEDFGVVTQFIDDSSHGDWIETHSGHVEDVFDDIAFLLADDEAYTLRGAGGTFDELCKEIDRQSE
ncbi:hypothetical protein DVK00_02905 [Haloarcula sp. Atlit-47R]|uniref:hypothetical protein n=1 Tax=Haloarcula sp. Atlit-47R TaxID=2282132 RepID=UPI000EF1E573|nr:hypothetical protein [Haloarcula sp. Atlit-47R]RLM47474.1 hypothetical protein DVK00_02905 [Haloarcula sp. Atlit-47R]